LRVDGALEAGMSGEQGQKSGLQACSQQPEARMAKPQDDEGQDRQGVDRQATEAADVHAGPERAFKVVEPHGAPWDRCQPASRLLITSARGGSQTGSDAGGVRAARIYSLIASAKRHSLEPYAFRRALFERLPSHPAHRLQELAPATWVAHSATR
jgi:hypothetical protein